MRRIAVLAFLVTAACGGSGAAPSAPEARPVGFSGFWSGTFKYTQCSGERHCFAVIGRSESFTLRLQQSGARAHGVFTVLGYAVELDGSVMQDGTIELTGSAPTGSDKDIDAAIEITRFSASLSPAVGFAGTVAYALHANQTNSEFLNATLAGDIVNATRQDLPAFAASFSGLWKGRFVVRGCSAVGKFCYPHDLDDLAQVELQLVQDGDRVTGTMAISSTRMPVSGRVSGSAMVLEGEAQTASSGGPSLTRLTGWATTRDGFGRLQGTFDFTFGWPMNAPVLGESAHAELWQVVKVQ